MLQKYIPKCTVPSVFNDADFDSLFSNMLDRFLYPKFNYNYESVTSPLVRTHIHEQEYVLNAELPGYSKENLKVEVLDNTIVITGNIESKDTNDSKTTKFHKEFLIPSDVLIENIKASLENGILDVVLPRKEVMTRKIEIT